MKNAKQDADSQRGLPIQLRFEGSSDLKEVATSLVKSELRQAFARRSFYLYLRTPQPVELQMSYDDIQDVTRPDHMIDGYYANLATKHKGRNVYANHLRLAPLMGHYDHPSPQRGVSLLFKLAVDEYEKQKLTSPPFESMSDQDLYVTHYLPERLAIPEGDRQDVYEAATSVLGVNNPAVRRRGYAYDTYYVSHPTILQTQGKRISP